MVYFYLIFCLFVKKTDKIQPAHINEMAMNKKCGDIIFFAINIFIGLVLISIEVRNSTSIFVTYEINDNLFLNLHSS